MFKKPFRIGSLSWTSQRTSSGGMSASPERTGTGGPAGGDEKFAEAELLRLLERRIILLSGPINDDSAATVIAMLLYLEREDGSSPVQIHINSPGGGVSAGLAIIDTIRYLRTPVHTFCLGAAQGMAAVILASGSKGHRRASAHARIALTPLRGGAMELPADPETYYKELLRMQKMLIDLVVEFTGQPEPEVRDLFEEGRWFNAGEAKEYGLIDEVAS